MFATFLKLGLTSFGGPVAHLGYFRADLVERRGWIDGAGYAELVALCQFLPGPASSQVGFALGVLRAGGLIGGIAAWCGFTLPSAVLLTGFAVWAERFDVALAVGLLHGLKLVAVAVVAQAVWGMARTLAPDRTRATIAFAALAMTSLAGTPVAPLAAIAIAALAGLALCPYPTPVTSGALPVPVSRRQGAAALTLFAAGLLALPLAVRASDGWAIRLFDAFYRSGALVFGGGHVVLPLLQGEVAAPLHIPDAAFLAGYGAAQAVPGPLFTVAAYLGAIAPQPGHLAGAAIALVGIFLPGLLLVYGALPFWSAIRAHPAAGAAMRGANAAVVGILGAALYSPVWTSAVLGARDMVIAVGGFLLLTVARAPAWVVVLAMTASGIAQAVL